MPEIKLYHYDAFSKIAGKGNPAGIVLNAGHLTEEEMQQIDFQVGFNETVFVLESAKADLRLRYFTPGQEMGLCGHATIGALYGMKANGLLGQRDHLQIETNEGILPISFCIMDKDWVVKMKQGAPRFTPFSGNTKLLCESIGLMEADLDPAKPIMYGNTGTWTLIVPVQKLSRFYDMKPNNKLFPDILTELPRASVHPISFETIDPGAFMHGRHFSSPFSGTTEDPVTGTASGVMGAYYLSYINGEADVAEFTVEQGQEMGRDGRVFVQAGRTSSGMEVFISGTSVFVDEIEIAY